MYQNIAKIKVLQFSCQPVTSTGFFIFSPTIYPQKPPCPVSGKLSSTPKPCKVAHLLRFFGKHLCLHRRSFMRRRVTSDFLTQCVTYYKSTLVYYTIPTFFSKPQSIPAEIRTAVFKCLRCFYDQSGTEIRN